MGFLDAVFDPGARDREKARNALTSVPVPTMDELRIQLEQYVLQGQLSPEEANAYLQDQTAFDQVTTDPRLRRSQIGALDELENISREGGLDARAKSTLEDTLARQRTESRGDQEAILANSRARGTYGSDVETVNRLIASSGAATRGSRAALDSAAMAQARRDSAITQAAGLSGSIRTADWNEASDRATATDAINRFNAAQKQGVENTNVANRNAAQATNLGARQAVSDANVDQRNATQTYNAKLPMTIYNAQHGQAQDLAGAYDAEGAAKNARNQRIGSTVTSIGGLIAGGGFGALAGGAAAGASAGGIASASGGQDLLDKLARRLLDQGQL